MGAGLTRSRETVWRVLRSLRVRSGGCSLLKNSGRLVHFCDAEEDQRRIRSWLQATVRVVDVDVGLSQAGCYPRDLTGSVRKFDLDHFCLCAGDTLGIEGCFSSRRIVSDETSYSFPPDGERVQPENVHIAIGERPANFAECPRPIFHQNREFFGDWHRGPPFPDRECRKHPRFGVMLGTSYAT